MIAEPASELSSPTPRALIDETSSIDRQPVNINHQELSPRQPSSKRVTVDIADGEENEFPMNKTLSQSNSVDPALEIRGILKTPSGRRSEVASPTKPVLDRRNHSARDM